MYFIEITQSILQLFLLFNIVNKANIAHPIWLSEVNNLQFTEKEGFKEFMKRINICEGNQTK